MARTQSLKNGAFDSRQLLAALKSLKKGDFSVRLPGDSTGPGAAIAEAFNDVVELMENTTQEVERVSTMVGKEGKIRERASLPGAVGGWTVRIEFVNALIGDLVRPIEEVSRVIGAVAKG